MTSPISSGVRFSLGGPLTPIVRNLIIINSAAYLLLSLSSLPTLTIYELLGLSPTYVVEELALWQLITYMFLHSSSIWHVLFNMLILWWFGSDIERNWGGKLFLRYYLMSGVFAGLFVVAFSLGSKSVTIGASGAVMAILFAYAMSYPNRVILFMFVIPMKVKYFVLLLAAIEVFGVAGTAGSNVSHLAHIGGLVFGLLWFLYYTRRLQLPSLKRLLWKKRMRGKLRIVRDSKKDKSASKQNNGPTYH